MADWVKNVLTVKNTGAKYEELKNIFKPWNSNSYGVLAKIKPIPKNLIDVMLTNTVLFSSTTGKITQIPDPYKKMGAEKRAALLSAYGADNVGSWCRENWGTSKEACVNGFLYDDLEEFSVEFETAWDAPFGIFKEISISFPNLSFVAESTFYGPCYMSLYSYSSNKRFEFFTRDMLDDDLSESCSYLRYQLTQECANLIESFKCKPVSSPYDIVLPGKKKDDA